MAASKGNLRIEMAHKVLVKLGLAESPQVIELQGETGMQLWDQDFLPSLVGREIPKVDAEGRALGMTKRLNDIGPRDLPGLLYGRVLCSPHAVARVESIDASKALVLPGVKAVITRNRVEGFIAEPSCRTADGSATQRPEAGPVLFAGEVIATVAAETEAIAEDAVKLIEIGYREVSPTADDEDAGQTAGPQPPEGERVPGPESKPLVRERGNVEQAFRNADLAAYEGTFRVPTLPNGLEPPGSVAVWEGDTLTVHASTSDIFGLRSDLQKLLDVPESNIRVMVEGTAQGFHSRAFGVQSAWVAALLAKKASRPVKLLGYRRADRPAAGTRPPATVHIKVAARKDGSLHAIDFRSHGVGGGVSAAIWLTYKCPNIRTEVTEVRAHDSIGSGAADLLAANFALEQAMDGLARGLGMDPLEFRRRNLQPYLPLEKMFEIGVEKIGWSERRAATADAGPIKHGVGMAVGAWGNPGGAFAQAVVRVHPDGRVDVVVGAQDAGAGTRTVLGMVAAEELGVPLEKVKVSLGDTAAGLAAPASGAGVTLASVGSAVRQAAHDAKQKIAARVAAVGAFPTEGSSSGEEPTVDSQSVSTVATRAPRPMPWTPEGRALVSAPVVGYGQSGESPTGNDYPAWVVQFVDVSVDTETGLVKVNKVVSLAEAGRVMNRLTFETELIGGAIRGLSAALFEEPVVDRQTGRTLNPNLRDCKPLGALESPPIEAVIIDAVSPTNCLGVKGLGDLPMIPTAAALANAVAHALGARVCELPLTPARILSHL
jgi:xanthine dehydrogenase YagR molybdenum-binding subunit